MCLLGSLERFEVSTAEQTQRYPTDLEVTAFSAALLASGRTWLDLLTVVSE